MRTRLIPLLAAALGATGLGVTALETRSAADPPAPVILNNGTTTSGNAQWLETQNLTDRSHIRTIRATFLVSHAAGRTITGVVEDSDWNGSDETDTNGVIAVSAQRYPTSGTSLMTTSRVTVDVNVGNGPDNSGRAFNDVFRMRVVDSTGERSARVDATIRFVEEGNSLGSQDFPGVESVSQSEGPDMTPGNSFNVTMRCDDPDTDPPIFNTDDDECDRIRYRWRNLGTGSTTGTTEVTGWSDNSKTFSVTAPSSRGYYVLEAELGNENGNYPTNGGGQPWWRLASAAVNDSSSVLEASMSFSGAEPSSPPSVNPGTAVNAVATVDDIDAAGSEIQVIEWDATDNGTFERFESTAPAVESGNIDHDPVTASQRTQAVNTATPGLKTVAARITDNGALDAADSVRRQRTFEGQLRVNAIPVASNVTVNRTEDSAPVAIDLVASDGDDQPAPLTYHLVSGLSNPSLGSLSSIVGDAITFTPAPNANGSATFSYRVRDGNDSTVGANAFSNTATVTINVSAVNDAPTLSPASITTQEDIPKSVQLVGNDIDSSTLTYSVNPGGQATNGTVTCSSAGLCTYTPDGDFNGNDSFVARVSDGSRTATTTVPIVVTAVNDAPVANSQTVPVVEDAANVPITLTASDVDNVVLTYTAPITNVGSGTLSCVSFSCTYTPNPNFNGTDSFTFRASDGTANSNVATVTLAVSPVNDGPVATDVPDAETDEDVPLALALGGTDIDTDQTVTVASVDDPAHGTTTVDGPNLVTYTPDADFHGIDTFDFEVTDSNGGFDTGTVSVTVHPVNDAPVIPDQTFTIQEDTPTFLSVAAGDVDGDTLAWSVTDDPEHGSVVPTFPDTVYVPDTNFHGEDTFEVTVSDGHGGSATALITVVVQSVNDQPAAVPQVVSTSEDTSTTLTLLADDADAGDLLSFTAPVDGPFSGDFACVGAACTYTPNPDFHGRDHVTFEVDDGEGGTDTASVTIEVASVNDPPSAVGATVVTEEDTAVAVALTATDVDQDLLTFSYGDPGSGTVTGSGPDVVYTPNPNHAGGDSFSFTVDDGEGGTDSETVIVVISAVNDAPIAIGGTVSTDEDTPVTFSLGATDVEGAPLTFAVTDEPDTGVLSCDDAGACTYTPAADFTGEEQLTYTVSDGEATGSGSFTILVGPVNDPPVAVDGAVVTDEDTPATFSLDATDTEGDGLTFSVVSGPTHGTVECSASGFCTYTPAANSDVDDGFVWSVSDGGASDTGTTVIDVTPVNDAPQALDVAAGTGEGQAVSFLLEASDPEGDPVTFTVASGPGDGSVSIAGSVATYTPDPGFSGTDQFTFRATDSSGDSTTAVATVVVDELVVLGTNLVGDAAVAQVQLRLLRLDLGGLVVFPRMSATLRDDAGLPVVGATLRFEAAGREICRAVTDSQGAGVCSGSGAIRALLSLGYRVHFDGDAGHLPSSASGPILQVLTLRLF